MQEDSADRGKNDNMAHTGTMVNADGKEKEKNVWGKLSDWVDYSGDVDGEKVGVAIFDNPQNSRRAIWHSRGYGLFAANPFGRTAFDKASPDGSVSLEPGATLHFRYRIIMHSGDAANAGNRQDVGSVREVGGFYPRMSQITQIGLVLIGVICDICG